MRRECSCGRLYWPAQAWQHAGCAINSSAINKANGETPLDQPVIPVVGAKPAGVDSPERRTPNRRSREAYNEYMREYMRKVRSKK